MKAAYPLCDQCQNGDRYHSIRLNHYRTIAPRKGAKTHKAVLCPGCALDLRKRGYVVEIEFPAPKRGPVPPEKKETTAE